MSKTFFRVGRSRTGLGLFATELIEKGTLIAEYKGRRVTNAEAEELEAKNSRYMYEINSRWTVDGSGRKNTARYANHSCRPNAESDVIRGPRARGRKGGMVILRATKNIKPGDEITYDYGRDYFNGFLKPIGCKCLKCVEKRREERRAKRLAKQRAALRAKRRAQGNGGRSRSR
jgi:hypothetical protein